MTAPEPTPAQPQGFAARHAAAGEVFAAVRPWGEHRYVSTYCVHGDCGQCRRTCKTCEAPCLHACHDYADEPAACDAYIPPSIGRRAESGLCARCGMADYKHPAPAADGPGSGETEGCGGCETCDLAAELADERTGIYAPDPDCETRDVRTCTTACPAHGEPPATADSPRWTSCGTSQHCAAHGWCHRCAPNLAVRSSAILKAVREGGLDESKAGGVYEVIAEQLRLMQNDVIIRTGSAPGPAGEARGDLREAIAAAVKSVRIRPTLDPIVTAMIQTGSGFHLTADEAAHLADAIAPAVDAHYAPRLVALEADLRDAMEWLERGKRAETDVERLHRGLREKTALITAVHAELAAIADDTDGWDDEHAGGMHTAAARIRRTLRGDQHTPDEPTLRAQLARTKAALSRVQDYADTLDEMGENAARPDDQRLYQAIAADIRKHTTTKETPGA